MSLTNAQFDAILRSYEDTRLRNHRILENRRKEIRETLDGYSALEDSVVNVSMEAAKNRLGGSLPESDDLHSLLAELKSMKQCLLTGAGYPADYLDPIYDCPDCKDTGYIGTEKCHCLNQKIVKFLYEQSNIFEYIASNNFSTLSYDYYSGEDFDLFKKAVDACHHFIDNFDTERGNLLFYGTVGTGKSFLSCCVAKELIDRGYSVLYFSAASLFNALAKETFENKAKDDLYNLYDYIYNCDLLIIDDLGTELTNSFVSSQLFSCINERNLRKKSTIISTNLTLELIRDRYSDRVFSRLVNSYSVNRLSGPDIRIIKKTTV